MWDITFESRPYGGGTITVARQSTRWSPPLPKVQEVKWTPSRGLFGADSFHPKTELGRRLWEMRMKRIAAGGRLMGTEEIEREIRELRGERYDERP